MTKRGSLRGMVGSVEGRVVGGAGSASWREKDK